MLRSREAAGYHLLLGKVTIKIKLETQLFTTIAKRNRDKFNCTSHNLTTKIRQKTQLHTCLTYHLTQEILFIYLFIYLPLPLSILFTSDSKNLLVLFMTRKSIHFPLNGRQNIVLIDTIPSEPPIYVQLQQHTKYWEIFSWLSFSLELDIYGFPLQPQIVFSTPLSLSPLLQPPPVPWSVTSCEKYNKKHSWCTIWRSKMTLSNLGFSGYKHTPCHHIKNSVKNDLSSHMTRNAP